ncbi:MAG: phosphoenolpyruvate--protein phosphotransferase [Gemmatimonadota bacterium]
MTHRLIRGVAVSPGIAVGPVLVVRWELPPVPERTIAAGGVARELRRLREALDWARERVQRMCERAAERTGPEEARIFDAQLMMLEDEDLVAGVERLVRENHFTAERAVELKMLEWRGLWTSQENATLRDRLADLADVEVRVIGHLMDLPERDMFDARPEAPVVIVARDLTPSLTLQMDRTAVLGIACEQGTRTSHAAILAHSLGIPAVMGLQGVLERVESGDQVVVDGWAGTLQVRPTTAEITAATARDRQRRELNRELVSGAKQAAVTPDGHAVRVRANLDLPEELDAAVRSGADGVGLMRTEFLVVGRNRMPTEDEQATLYRRVGEAFAGHDVVVRTFDIGGDKFPTAFRTPTEANPFLGWRAIRVCLDEPDVFRPQIRAILRAAAHAPVKLMIPMVSSVDEVEATRELVDHEARALKRAGIDAAASVPVGVMVETPAAAILADRFAAVADFLSVGTNDLTQYTLAVDRSNARLAARFSPLHPSVLRLLRDIQVAGAAAGREVSVCGEMASDPIAAVILIGLGYRTLSVAAPSLPLVKWLVRRISAAEAAGCATAALAAPSPGEAAACARDALGSHVDLRLLDPSARLPGRARKATLQG